VAGRGVTQADDPGGVHNRDIRNYYAVVKPNAEPAE
jgi:hypothetical protein